MGTIEASSVGSCGRIASRSGNSTASMITNHLFGIPAFRTAIKMLFLSESDFWNPGAEGLGGCGVDFVGGFVADLADLVVGSRLRLLVLELGDCLRAVAHGFAGGFKLDLLWSPVVASAARAAADDDGSLWSKA